MDMDDDLAGPAAVLRAATWTDEQMRARLQEKVADRAARALLELLLRVDPCERLQSMEDVLFHQFFDSAEQFVKSNRSSSSSSSSTARDDLSHSSEPRPTGGVAAVGIDAVMHVTSSEDPIIGLAKQAQICPLEDEPALYLHLWKFRKLEAHLNAGPGGRAPDMETGEHLTALAGLISELFAEASSVLRERVERLRLLPDELKLCLKQESSKVLSAYGNVQKSILDNLVVQEVAVKTAFEGQFSLLAAAVTLRTPQKPKQQAVEAAVLFASAARVMPHFAQVRVERPGISGGKWDSS